MAFEGYLLILDGPRYLELSYRFIPHEDLWRIWYAQLAVQSWPEKKHVNG